MTPTIPTISAYALYLEKTADLFKRLEMTPAELRNEIFGSALRRTEGQGTNLRRAVKLLTDLADDQFPDCRASIHYELRNPEFELNTTTAGELSTDWLGLENGKATDAVSQQLSIMNQITKLTVTGLPTAKQLMHMRDSLRMGIPDSPPFLSNLSGICLTRTEMTNNGEKAWSLDREPDMYGNDANDRLYSLGKFFESLADQKDRKPHTDSHFRVCLTSKHDTDGEGYDVRPRKWSSIWPSIPVESLTIHDAVLQAFTYLPATTKYHFLFRNGFPAIPEDKSPDVSFVHTMWKAMLEELAPSMAGYGEQCMKRTATLTDCRKTVSPAEKIAQYTYILSTSRDVRGLPPLSEETLHERVTLGISGTGSWAMKIEEDGDVNLIDPQTCPLCNSVDGNRTKAEMTEIEAAEEAKRLAAETAATATSVDNNDATL